MKYLLDTNVCIKYLNGSSESVKRHIKKLHPSEIVICSVVKSERQVPMFRTQAWIKLTPPLCRTPFRQQTGSP
ncbi:MAG: type II toxin-antitoxin system VapC family toxin [Deltaproteobacteria bacterium]|nr:type II toxin-antitoxin system VapC family toxin [Deltaproteobacteria bacterium]